MDKLKTRVEDILLRKQGKHKITVVSFIPNEKMNKVRFHLVCGCGHKWSWLWPWVLKLSKDFSPISCPSCMRDDKAQQKAIDFKKLMFNKYPDYDFGGVTHYYDSHDHIDAVCDTHGMFRTTFTSLLHGDCGCPICANLKPYIHYKKLFKETHGFTYTYPVLPPKDYHGSKTYLNILCDKCGVFTQKINSHVNGNGCPSCHLFTVDDYLSQCKETHGDRYDYSRINKEAFKGVKDKVPIVCKEHGVFYQTMDSHKRGCGCPDCSVSGFKSSKPAYLYVFSWNLGNSAFIKFGITNLPVKDRGAYQSRYTSYHPTILNTYYFENGGDAYNLEQLIKKTFPTKVIPKHKFPDGYTETTRLSNYPRIIELIEQQLARNVG